MSAFEKCLWYWNMVNELILNIFSNLNPNIYHIVNIEKINVKTVKALCEFLELNDISEDLIEQVLSKRVNASPGEKDIRSVNPYATQKTLEPFIKWNALQKMQLREYVGNLRTKLYGKET
jgi:hypothetical protein